MSYYNLIYLIFSYYIHFTRAGGVNIVTEKLRIGHNSNNFNY